MEIGFLKIIEVSYNISTLFLLSLIAYLLLKDKFAFENLKRKKYSSENSNVNKDNKKNRQLDNTIGPCPYELVKKLSNHGWTKEEISKKVGLPSGEVELVLKFKA